MAAQRSMPSAEAICDYWSNDIRLQNRSMMTDICWMCGRISKLERAHIVPKCKGGPDDASNLHLLCPGCHKETENIEIEEQYWAYFNATDYSPLKMAIERAKKLIAAGVDFGLTKEDIELFKKEFQ